jgi:hydroxyethylthiazole kinase
MELGYAGHIAGQPNRMHFEIVCDDANLERLIGRKTGELNTAQNGRSDAVFGEIYFRVPAGTPVYDVPANRRMRDRFANNNVAQTVAAATHVLGTPQNVTENQTRTTSEECIVGLRYATGEGPVASHGNLEVVTYANVNGEYREYGRVTHNDQLSNVIIHANTPKNTYAYRDAEYHLYFRTNEICAEWPDGPNRPMPSAVYELLKFGRVLNTGQHGNVNVADVPIWRKVRVPLQGGPLNAWVNLNSPNIHVFSDADFPQWRGWKICDDDSSADSRCDANGVKQLLDEDGDGNITPAERRTRMNLAEVRETMRRVICSFPTEWNPATVDAHWAWLKTQTVENPEPLSDEDFTGFSNHLQALCFASNDLITATRHFHPKGFIEAFRKCLWFTADELAQCLPRRPAANVTDSWQTARQRASAHYIALNLFFQKFCGHSRNRAIHNLAQILLETGRLRTLSEDSRGRRNNGTDYDYDAFYGRGYHQITWVDNYLKFERWRKADNHLGAYSDPFNRLTQTSLHRKAPGTNLSFRWGPRFNPSLVEVPYEAAESSGVYWLSKSFRGNKNLNRVSDLEINPSTITFVSWCVNGGDNGLRERQVYAKFLSNILSDLPLFPGTQNENFRYPLPTAVNTTYPPPIVQGTQNATVYYAYQRP